jgi:hypothetical protein
MGLLQPLPLFVKQETSGFLGESEVFSMSTIDTMTPLISSLSRDASGKPLSASGKSLSVRVLPELRREALKTLDRAYPDVVSPALGELSPCPCGETAPPELRLCA